MPYGARRGHKSNMWMWATSPLPSPSSWSSSISLCTTTASTKSLQRLFSLAVSAQPRQPPRTRNDHPTVGLVGQAVHTAFKSNAKHQSSSLGSPLDSPGQQRPLSGSDVLWALKRATAEKSKKKKKDVSFTSRAPKLGSEQEKAAADHTSVRPLTIKTEWIVRLEQLQKRLQQLLDA